MEDKKQAIIELITNYEGDPQWLQVIYVFVSHLLIH